MKLSKTVVAQQLYTQSKEAGKKKTPPSSLLDIAEKIHTEAGVKKLSVLSTTSTTITNNDNNNENIEDHSSPDNIKQSKENDESSKKYDLRSKLKPEKKKRPNFFLSIRLDSPELQESFRAFVRHVNEKDPDFAKLTINPPQVHVTLFVMHLGDKEEIEKARQCLLQNKELLDTFFPEGGPLLHFLGIDTFENGRVVFTTPKQTPGLTEFCKLSRALFDRFHAAGLLPDQSGKDFEAEFKPHATLMKVSGKRLFISRKKLLNKEAAEDEDEIDFGSGFDLLFNDEQEETGHLSVDNEEELDNNNGEKEEETKEPTTNMEELTGDHKISNTSLLTEKDKEEAPIKGSSADSVVMMDENQDTVTTTKEPAENNYEEFAYISSTSDLKQDLKIPKRELKKMKKAEKLERVLKATTLAKSTKKGKNKKRKRVRRVPPELYKAFTDFDFGTHIIKGVDLCSMLQPKAEDGYYAGVERIEFREQTAKEASMSPLP
ncbi:6201_t:CDS:2 [Ambispora gerdemannii]|uniref:6201_t:CDS:1 n=1 Tax=Ambispora gerdemannii TaxID=144530 RepID=A0A9N9AIX8_9GLOM|nr:6201_t:CDS:2 [Ambispora gerdemannii]